VTRVAEAAEALRAAPRWRLEPLLGLRSEEELRELERLCQALAAARRAWDEAAVLRDALAVPGAAAAPGVVASGGDLADAHRFLARLRRELADATERVRASDAAALEARAHYAQARGAREGLERERERWFQAWRRAREARADREVEDMCARERPCVR
jgi:hypothetical protein